MSEEVLSTDPLSILSLSETRRFLRQFHARMMVVFFAVLYALGSMVLGGMLILTRVEGGYTAEVLWGSALGTGWWNYPGYLLVAPWGVISLPFLATWAMVVVSIGVGIGVSVAILIAVRLARDRRRSAAQPGSVGAVAGLTPAMIALVTLGACCSTTAAATAGVGLVAQSSGSTIDNLLINNWYLDLFQISIIGVALLAQEMILRIYGGLFGLSDAGRGAPVPTPGPRPVTARSVAIGVLRAALLLAGVTWSLAMFAEWTTISPATASAAMWFQWIFQHQLLAIFALAVALFPNSIARAFSNSARRSMGLVARTALLLGGFSLAVWVPGAVASAGAFGFANELFGALGLPAAWGSVAPVFAPGLALYLRWGFQYLLLGGFAIAVAIAPGRILGPLRWSAPTASGSGTVPSAAGAHRASGSFPGYSFSSSEGGAPETPSGARGIEEP